MRKRLITPIPQDAPPHDEDWLDLDDAAVVEVTSEETDYPVESALVSREMRGWRAADPGSQTIRNHSMLTPSSRHHLRHHHRHLLCRRLRLPLPLLPRLALVEQEHRQLP